MPIPAIKVHASVPLAEGIFQHLKPETALLVESCPVTAPHSEWEEVDSDGEPIAWFAFNHTLQWELDGYALQRTGLVDYFPGLRLDTGALAFLNATGQARPFQFSETEGFLFYDAPMFDPRGGDLPRFSCRITLRFGKRRGAGTSTGSGGGSGGGSFAFYLAPQPVFRFSETTLADLLADVFHGTSHFSGSVEFTLYDGPPAGGGSVVYAARAGGPFAWTQASTSTRAVFGSLVNEWPANVSASTFNHARISRTGWTVDMALGSVTVPAGQVLAMAADCFRAGLTVPASGVSGVGNSGAAEVLLHYLFGTEPGVEDSDVTVQVQCYDGDPDNGGNYLDGWAVARDSDTWDITANGDGSVTVANVDATAGTAPAAGGGWSVRYVTVSLSAVNAYVVKKAFPVALEFAGGVPITLPTGEIDLTVS